MAKFKEGDRVQIIEREVTTSDKESNRYYAHMAGLTGTVQNVYAPEENAVRVDIDSLGNVAADVHKKAVKRMREKFLSSIGEEQKKKLTKEELNFNAHYMLLVHEEDMKKI